MLNKILLLVSQVMDVPLDRVHEGSSAATLEEWDSLRQMTLVLALEEEFQVTFSDEEIVEMLSVEAILKVLSTKRP